MVEEKGKYREAAYGPMGLGLILSFSITLTLGLALSAVLFIFTRRSEVLILGVAVSVFLAVTVRSHFLRTSRVAQLLRTRRGELHKLQEKYQKESKMRLAAEKALREAEKLYRVTTDSMNDGIMIVDRDLRLVHFNYAIENLSQRVGIDTEGIIGQNMFDIFPFLTEKIRNEYQQVFETGRVMITEDSNDVLDSMLWTETYKIPVYDDDKVYLVVTVLHDITGQKSVETELQSSRGFLQKLIDNLPLAVFAKTVPDGKFMIWNKQAENIFGLNADDVIGKTDYDFFPKDQADSFREKDSEVLNARQAVDIPEEPINSLSLGRRVLHTIKVPVVDEKDKPVCLLGISEDITSNLDVRKALRESRQTLDLAIKGANLGVWEWNPQTGALNYNDRWREMLGYGPDELKPTVQAWQDLIHPDDKERTLQSVEDYLEGRIPFLEIAYRLRTKAGRWKWMLDCSQIFERDENDKPVRVVGTHMDITAHKAAEEARIGANIQQALLWCKVPDVIEGAELAVKTVPSRKIGGDFHDFITFDKNRFDVLLGDVMGKGVGAALLGAGIKNEFLHGVGYLVCSGDFTTFPTPEDLVTYVNRQIGQRFMALGSFATLCYARFDLSLCKMQLVDCGHTRTVYYSAKTNKVDLLKGDNLPLGVRDNEEYRHLAVALQSGDVMLFYSDGLTEARNADGDEYGTGRLVDFVQAHKDQHAQEIIDKLFDELAEFSGANHFMDDLTCVAIKIRTIG